MIRVVNYKTFTEWNPNAENVGIQRPRLLGNPYREWVWGRDECIRMYRPYLWTQMQNDTPIRREILRLARLHLQGKEVVLVCGCKPLDCHGDIIKAAIEWLARIILWASRSRSDIWSAALGRQSILPPLGRPSPATAATGKRRWETTS